MGATEGLTKMVLETETERVLGMGIVEGIQPKSNLLTGFQR
jgi:pyruvate/2-oxoglutarate dehydrogenase complex dihydrolipoamide dehydrogenase (E3) component